MIKETTEKFPEKQKKEGTISKRGFLLAARNILVPLGITYVFKNPLIKIFLGKETGAAFARESLKLPTTEFNFSEEAIREIIDNYFREDIEKNRMSYESIVSCLKDCAMGVFFTLYSKEYQALPSFEKYFLDIFFPTCIRT